MFIEQCKEKFVIFVLVLIISPLAKFPFKTFNTVNEGFRNLSFAKIFNIINNAFLKHFKFYLAKLGFNI